MSHGPAGVSIRPRADDLLADASTRPGASRSTIPGDSSAAGLVECNRPHREDARRRAIQFLLKLNNLPNTVLGLTLGAIGLLFGARVSVGNNAIQFLGHPLMLARFAATIGNVVLYGRRVTPASVGFDGNLLGDHERQHTIQGEHLGVLYLPSNLFGGLAGLLVSGDWYGRANWNERGPQQHPSRPW